MKACKNETERQCGFAQTSDVNINNKNKKKYDK